MPDKLVSWWDRKVPAAAYRRARKHQIFPSTNYMNDNPSEIFNDAIPPMIPKDAKQPKPKSKHRTPPKPTYKHPTLPRPETFKSQEARDKDMLARYSDFLGFPRDHMAAPKSSPKKSVRFHPNSEMWPEPPWYYQPADYCVRGPGSMAYSSSSYNSNSAYTPIPPAGYAGDQYSDVSSDKPISTR